MTFAEDIDDYAIEERPKPENVLLHQRSCGNVRRERKSFALLGDGVSTPEAEDGWQQRAPIYGEGH